MAPTVHHFELQIQVNTLNRYSEQHGEVGLEGKGATASTVQEFVILVALCFAALPAG